MEATATETIINLPATIPKPPLPATLDTNKMTLPEVSDIIGEGGADSLKEQVRILAYKEAEGADASTESGRETLTSVAYTVAKSKTYIDKTLKDYTEDQRRIINEVNAARKTIKEGLEELQEELKAPVTAWENAEADRVKRHEDALTALDALVQFDGIPSATVLGARLSQFKARQPRDWEEYYERAAELIAHVEKHLTEGYDRQQRYETEQAELAELRAEKAQREEAAAAEKARVEQEAADRAAEEKRKADMAEAARLAKIEAEQEAEKAAAASHAAFEARLRETEQAAQRAKDEAAAKLRAADEARIAAEKRIEFERAQAEEAKTQAAAAAETKQKAALEAQQRQAEQERQLQAEEDKKRSEDLKHRKAFNREILDALRIHLIYGEEQGQHLVKAIVQGKIPHVTVNY